MASLMTGVMPVCQPCMRKQGRRARCRWTSPTAANRDISRDRIKYLESRLADLERHGFDNAAFHGTQGEKLEPSQAFPSQSEARTLENVQAENLDITAVPEATRNLLG